MKFPITRESLQAFDYAKAQEERREKEVQKEFAHILIQLRGKFEQDMVSNMKEKRFVWHNLNVLTLRVNMQMNSHCQPNYETIDGLPLFIDKLKELFIGCDIIVDPLKTYLIIDWS